MLFSSVPFLFYFLPCVLAVYFLAPKRLKNAVLLLFSLAFYAWGEPKYVFLMLGTLAAGYVFGLLIERFRGKAAASVCLAFSVSLTLALLAFFKYVDFFIANFNAVTGLSVPLLRIALPIGISFYTFQILSYSIDVYRGTPAQRNPIDLAAYIALFPQLIAGPIVRYGDIAAQLKDRTHSLERCALGARRFILGLAKKVLIANQLGALCAAFRESEASVLFHWLYAVSFSLQIYFDFSGYSDMAIGLGKLFGFDFLENFRHPFTARSITEFWRRWHISLGSWFRDYVYIPLGGNRCSRTRWLLNILIVWMLTGFWHGAAWNFVLWGLYFAALLVLEKLWLRPHLERHRILSHIYVLLLVVFSFVLFNAADLRGALSDLGGCFGAGGIPLLDAEFVYSLRSYGIILVLAIIGATPLPAKLLSRLRENSRADRVIAALEPFALAALLVAVTAFLVDGSFNPFLYFRF